MAPRPRPRLVLLDRDGVLNEDRPNWVDSPDQLVLIAGAAEAIAKLNREGIPVCVVTNQSVVGRGVIGEGMLATIHEKLHRELALYGAKLDAIILCTDAPEHATERRKPGAGMLREALAKFGTAPEESPMIGDSLRDLEAARKAGCPRILVRSGKGAKTAGQWIPPQLWPIAVYDDLAGAVDALLAAPTGARRSGFAGFALASLVALAALWAIGFVWFAAGLPKQVSDPDRKTDAIVVLTGGAERLHTGLDLLAKGLAGRLLVSGVHESVTVPELLRSYSEPPSLSCCIDLGYEAYDTVGNAAEASAWMRAQNFHSLRLVTATYHLPRSLLEFRSAMPDIEIVPNPVFPASMQGNDWWMRPKTIWFTAIEYSKFLVAKLRHLLTPAQGSP